MNLPGRSGKVSVATVLAICLAIVTLGLFIAASHLTAPSSIVSGNLVFYID